jgi:hypothetical protein
MDPGVRRDDGGFEVTKEEDPGVRRIIAAVPGMTVLSLVDKKGLRCRSPFFI